MMSLARTPIGSDELSAPDQERQAATRMPRTAARARARRRAPDERTLPVL